MVANDLGRTEVNAWRLYDIEQAEPDPSLFQVPPDYEIVEHRPEQEE